MGLTGLIFLLSKGLSRGFSNTTVQKSALTLAPARSAVSTRGLKISPTAAEHRHSSARNHLQVSGPGFISPPDSSFDGHTGWSVRSQGINHLCKGFKIPWELRGTWGGAGSGRVGVTPESQRPEASWEAQRQQIAGSWENQLALDKDYSLGWGFLWCTAFIITRPGQACASTKLTKLRESPGASL